MINDPLNGSGHLAHLRTPLLDIWERLGKTADRRMTTTRVEIEEI